MSPSRTGQRPVSFPGDRVLDPSQSEVITNDGAWLTSDVRAQVFGVLMSRLGSLRDVMLPAVPKAKGFLPSRN